VADQGRLGESMIPDECRYVLGHGRVIMPRVMRGFAMVSKVLVSSINRGSSSLSKHSSHAYQGEDIPSQIAGQDPSEGEHVFSMYIFMLVDQQGRGLLTYLWSCCSSWTQKDHAGTG